MVAGSEPTGEYRVQYFTPSYLLNGNPQPSISKAPGTLGYAAAFTVTYALASGSIGRCVVLRTWFTNILSVMQHANGPRSCSHAFADGAYIWCWETVFGSRLCFSDRVLT